MRKDEIGAFSQETLAHTFATLAESRRRKEQEEIGMRLKKTCETILDRRGGVIGEEEAYERRQTPVVEVSSPYPYDPQRPRQYSFALTGLCNPGRGSYTGVTIMGMCELDVALSPLWVFGDNGTILQGGRSLVTNLTEFSYVKEVIDYMEQSLEPRSNKILAFPRSV